MEKGKEETSKEISILQFQREGPMLGMEGGGHCQQLGHATCQCST